MKNADFWNIKTQFVPQRNYIKSPLQSQTGKYYIRYGVFMALTMRDADFWNIEIEFVPHRKHIMSPLQSPTD
jgi:hypothetical protein